VQINAEEFGSLFVADQMEKQLNTIGIIDAIVERRPREKGPTVGEYFFYAWVNRLVSPKSKRALGEWYRKTAIQHIRPVEVEKLTSQHYWEKWNRVSVKDIEKIGKTFFEMIWTLQELPPECVIFDTSNYYTYMAGHTDSELCQRRKNKAGKHHLRQLGVALMVDRKTQLPLYCKVYEGNRHDSKIFFRIIDEMFGVMCDFNQTKQRLTIVFDKGMNSDENIDVIDDHQRVHFITTYSPYFVEELATVDLKHFSPIITKSNFKLEENEKGGRSAQLLSHIVLSRPESSNTPLTASWKLFVNHCLSFAGIIGNPNLAGKNRMKLSADTNGYADVCISIHNATILILEIEDAYQK